MSAAATRTFDTRADEAARIDDFIAAFGAANGLPERMVFRARVCAAELAANVLEHGQARAGLDRMSIALSAGVGPPSLALTFSDTTAPFDPTRPEAIPAAADPDRAGGRGLMLLQKLSAARAYRHQDGHNIVDLQFLDADPPPVAA